MKKKAVALKYTDSQDSLQAPQVIAKGKGEIARRIIKLAEENGVVLYEDSDLVESLSQLNLMQEIPPRLYDAVAEVLAFVYRMNQNKK